MKASNFILAGALFVFGLVSLPSIVYSQSSEGRLDIEEIVVTGTKRDIGQQDAAIAVSAITEQAFRNTFSNEVTNLGSLVPNLTLTTQPGFNAVSGGIRGTGSVSILVTEDPSVAFLVDDFGLNHVQSQFVEMFDIEQIEVYRGPQGTLFGKNSVQSVVGKSVFDSFTIQNGTIEYKITDSSTTTNLGFNSPLGFSTLLGFGSGSTTVLKTYKSEKDV